MSEGVIIALISFATAVLGAAITGFATVAAAGLKEKSDGKGSISCAIVGLVASIGAIGGLVLGAFFGVFLLQKAVGGIPTELSTPTQLASLPETNPTQSIIFTDTPQTIIQQPLIPTSTPSLPPLPLPEGYISIGKHYLGMGSSDKAGNQVYSHFISGKIQYTRVMADDDIDKIELVCTDKVVDITERFYPIPKLDGDLFPNYASEVLEIPSNCRIDFYVIDIYGVASGIRVNSEVVP